MPTCNMSSLALALAVLSVQLCSTVARPLPMHLDAASLEGQGSGLLASVGDGAEAPPKVFRLFGKNIHPEGEESSDAVMPHQTTWAAALRSPPRGPSQQMEIAPEVAVSHDDQIGQLLSWGPEGKKSRITSETSLGGRPSSHQPATFASSHPSSSYRPPAPHTLPLKKRPRVEVPALASSSRPVEATPEGKGRGNLTGKRSKYSDLYAAMREIKDPSLLKDKKERSVWLYVKSMDRRTATRKLVAAGKPMLPSTKTPLSSPSKLKRLRDKYHKLTPEEKAKRKPRTSENQQKRLALAAQSWSAKEGGSPAPASAPATSQGQSSEP